MRTVLRLIFAIVTGAISGAMLGAGLLGISTYMNITSGWLGTARSWTGVAIYIGAICGVVPGTLIGLVIGITKCNKTVGAWVGAGTGALIALLILMMTSELDQEVRFWGVSAIPLGAVVGLAAAATTAMFGTRKSEEPK